MNKDDIAYAAGLFDAEGWVVISKEINAYKFQMIHPRYSLRIGLVSTNLSILNWFKDNFQGSIRIKHRKNICFEWQTCANRAVNFLRKVIVYLQIKKPQAQLAFRFQNEMRTKKEHGRITLKSLQQRGYLRNEIFALNHGKLVLNQKKLNLKSESTNNCEIAYVAGLLDGDGYISIYVKHSKGRINPAHYLLTGINSVNQPVLNLLKDNFNGCKCLISEKTRPYFAWKIGSIIAENFLLQVLPYLRIKKSQAKLALQFRNEKKRNSSRRRLTPEFLERREQFRQQMLALNRNS